MKFIIRKVKQKGVALVFALFTALLLMTLSITVVGLSIRHARVGGEADYVQEALHAADWYVGATLEYLHSEGALNTTQKYRYANPYTDDTRIVTGEHTDGVLGRDDVTASVIKLNDNQAQEYGLVGGSIDAHLIRFGSSEPLVYFPHTGAQPGAGFDSTSDRFAVCDVTVEKIPAQSGKYGTEGQPGYYHLCIISRVYEASAWSAVKRVKEIGLDSYPTEGLLATRMIEVKARTENVLDYLHIIQDGRSWRANGLNLDGKDGLFEQFMDPTVSGERALQILQNGLLNCGFPEGYTERGKLRIDGGTRMASSDTKVINNKATIIDGSAQFFNTKSSGFASFLGELTQNRSMNTMSFNNGEGSKHMGDVCSGGLNDSAGSIGLPSSGENSNYVPIDEKDRISGGFEKCESVGRSTGVKDDLYRYKSYADRDTYQSFARDKAKDSAKDLGGKTECAYDIGGHIGTVNSASSGVWKNKLPPSGKTAAAVPDVYTNGDSQDVRPSFAKIVVTLGEGDQLTISKENAKAGRSVQLYKGSASKIKNGIISVNGGNVEVRSETNGAGKAKKFTGDITIVADVEADREDSLAYFGDAKGKKCTSGKSIYSDAARLYANDNPEKVPPFSVKEVRQYAEAKAKESAEWGSKYKDASLVSKNDSAVVWPTPSSEATEREGNVYITGDIACGDTGDGKRGSVGIVAKNYVALNDKTVKEKDNGLNTGSKQTMSVEAMLFSFDKSVQFDWTNDAGNTDANFKALQRNADKRTFNLVGSVVSSNLDIEGSAEGVGYLIQNERSNSSLSNPPPFIPAYSEDANLKGGRWVIISTLDRGSRNWF